MKIDRLVSILSVLLQKEKVTTAYLAEKFEVSKRTIMRDIDSLNKAGIPIVTTQGNGGGVSIMNNYKLDKTLLSSNDLRSIIAGLKGLDSVSGTNQYKQLMEKLNAVDIDNQFIIDLSSWDKSAFADKIALIKSAIERKEKISFHYISPNGESERVLEPHHIIFQWSSWYVWGYCLKREDYRMFKLSRMTDLKATGEKCGDRIVHVYTTDKLRHTKGEIQATVRFDKSMKWRIVDEFGVDLLKYDSDGNIVVTFTWSDVPAFYQYILSFGNKAEILSPNEYRKEFAEILKNMQEHYQT